MADWELMSSFETVEAKRSFSKTTYDPLRQLMGEILRQGQESGEFASFPISTVASLIIGVLDGIILQWTWDAEAVDLEECRQEILRMLESFLHDGADTEGEP